MPGAAREQLSFAWYLFASKLSLWCGAIVLVRSLMKNAAIPFGTAAFLFQRAVRFRP